jgi:hypothetical protein
MKQYDCVKWCALRNLQTSGLTSFSYNNLLGVFVYFREDILQLRMMTEFLNETLT